MARKRKILFVTGTRAEYGLMRRTLSAIRESSALALHVMAIGQHLDRSRGYTVDEIRKDGFEPILGRAPHKSISIRTGEMVIDVTRAIQQTRPEIVLVVGDRIEAFAGASAAFVAGVVVAHVHGGDRAQGQVDDSLRHATTKLAHLHLVATRGAQQRVIKLGEDMFRIHRVGAPGLDGINEDARQGKSPASPFVLFIRHPFVSDDKLESCQTTDSINAILRGGARKIVALWPNNDPGCDGIARALERIARHRSKEVEIHRHMNRSDFLAHLRDCICLVGNSSAGIIEAGSFGTPVIDIGLRQQGREHGRNVTHVADDPLEIEQAIRTIIDHPQRYRMKNPWGDGNASSRIVQVLSNIEIDFQIKQKLISY